MVQGHIILTFVQINLLLGYDFNRYQNPFSFPTVLDIGFSFFVLWWDLVTGALCQTLVIFSLFCGETWSHEPWAGHWLFFHYFVVRPGHVSLCQTLVIFSLFCGETWSHEPWAGHWLFFHYFVVRPGHVSFVPDIGYFFIILWCVGNFYQEKIYGIFNAYFCLPFNVSGFMSCDANKRK